MITICTTVGFASVGLSDGDTKVKLTADRFGSYEFVTLTADEARAVAAALLAGAEMLDREGE